MGTNFYSDSAQTQHVCKVTYRVRHGKGGDHITWAIHPRELLSMSVQEQAVTTLCDEYGAVYSTLEFLASVAWPAAMWDFTLIGQEFS